MENVAGVNVFDAAEDLVEEVLRVLLCEALL